MRTRGDRIVAIGVGFIVGSLIFWGLINPIISKAVNPQTTAAQALYQRN